MTSAIKLRVHYAVCGIFVSFVNKKTKNMVKIGNKITLQPLIWYECTELSGFTNETC